MKRGTNVRVDVQKPDTRRERRASGRLTANPISTKYVERRFGDCAPKAIELAPGDLLCVASATEATERQSDHRAEVSRRRSKPCRRQSY